MTNQSTNVQVLTDEQIAAFEAFGEAVHKVAVDFVAAVNAAFYEVAASGRMSVICGSEFEYLNCPLGFHDCPNVGGENVIHCECNCSNDYPRCGGGRDCKAEQR